MSSNRCSSDEIADAFVRRHSMSLEDSHNHKSALNPQEQACLQREQIVLPSDKGTTRQISTAIFAPPTFDSPPSLSISIVFKQFPDFYRSRITIPSSPESIQGYEHIGFDSVTASKLYNHFSSFVEKWGYGTPNNMLSFARGHLKGARGSKDRLS